LFAAALVSPMPVLAAQPNAITDVTPATAPTAPAQHPPHFSHPPPLTLAFTAGVGKQYGHFGAQFLGVIPISTSPWSLFAGVGVGVTRTPEEWKTFDDRVPWKFAPVFLAGASLGRVHRLSAAVGYGRVALQPVVIQGAVVDAATVHGNMAEIGYEYVHPRGFVFRVFPAGITRTSDAVYTREVKRIGYSWSVGVGWRTH
jgi:hypothetical protein